MPNLTTLLRPDGWRALLALDDPVVLFKHSTGCGVSQVAYRAFCAWADGLAAQAPTLALVRVREERPLSLQIARDTGVRHESPQVIMLRRGHVVGSLSHGAITQASLTRLLAQALET